MTPSDSANATPPAVAAFLRGLHARAWLLARVQAGGDGPARQAMAVVASVFASDAGRWPIAEWPPQYWRLLLATPSLRQPSASAMGMPLPGIARLPPQQRAAVLLLLVGGLDEATAASALGVPVASYQDTIRASLPLDALGQPDVDVWRAWRAASERSLAEADTPVATAAHVAAGPADAANAAPAEPHASRHLLRWLWLGFAVCAIALGASLFLHPTGRAVLERMRDPIKRHELPRASPPKARFDPTNAALHPDRERLAAPGEAAYADNLARLAWLLVASSDVRAADAVRLPIAPMAGLAAGVPAPTLAQAISEWDALPPPMRGPLRAHWQAWRALHAGERVELRAIAHRDRQLTRDARQRLQERFDAQSSDERAGWWLGPRLGPHWPRVAALFAYVDAGERDALLRLLREANAEEIDALERLAQGTPPEGREALRRELLSVPSTQRTAWLQARALR